MSVVLKIVKWLLAIALAGVFIFAGANKLTSRIQPETYAFLAKAFNGIIKTWPWSLTGWSADTLRAVIGVSEVTFGLLALCPHYTRLSAFFFLSAMIGATYTHVAMQEPFIVTVVLGGLSFLLFLVSGDAVASTKKSVSAKKTN